MHARRYAENAIEKGQEIVGIAQKIAENSFFNFINNLTIAISGVVLSVVLARGLGPDRYGDYSYLMWLLGLGVLITNLGLDSMVSKYISESLARDKAKEAQGIVQLAIYARGTATVLVSLCIFLLSSPLARALRVPDERLYFALMVIVLLPTGITILLRAILAGFQQFKYNAYITLATIPLRAGLAMILVLLGYGVLELLSLELLIGIISLVLGAHYVDRFISLRRLILWPRLDRETVGTVSRYALAVTVILFIDFVLWQKSEVFFLKLYRSSAEVGFYNLVFNLSSAAMGLLPAVFGQVLMPAISEQFGRSDMDNVSRLYTRSARYLMLLAFPIAAGGIALARPVVTLVYGMDYASMVAPLRVLLISAGLGAPLAAAAGVIYGVNEPTFIIKKGLFLVPINIALNLWLVPRHGVLGAALGHTVTQLVSSPISIWFIWRRLGTWWPLLDSLKIASAAAFMALGMLVIKKYVLLVAPFGLILLTVIGGGLYLVAAMVAKIMSKEDLLVMRALEGDVPTFLRKGYNRLIILAERFV